MNYKINCAKAKNNINPEVPDANLISPHIGYKYAKTGLGLDDFDLDIVRSSRFVQQELSTYLLIRH